MDCKASVRLVKDQFRQPEEHELRQGQGLAVVGLEKNRRAHFSVIRFLSFLASTTFPLPTMARRIFSPPRRTTLNLAPFGTGIFASSNLTLELTDLGPFRLDARALNHLGIVRPLETLGALPTAELLDRPPPVRPAKLRQFQELCAAAMALQVMAWCRARHYPSFTSIPASLVSASQNPRPFPSSSACALPGFGQRRANDSCFQSLVAVSRSPI